MATKIDKLFALKAVEQKVADERKLIEYECRDELLEALEKDGTDRRTSPYFGPEAGKFSVKRYKAKPPKKVVEYNMTDDEAFAQWLDENVSHVIGHLILHYRDFVEAYFDGTGEVPDGIARVEYEEPGEPERLSAQIYSFKPDIVIEKLGANFLEGANQLLLGDGE